MNFIKLKTVNVIESRGENNIKIHSFPDNQEGNEGAENLFRELVECDAPSLITEEIEAFLEDGYYASEKYSPVIYLIHSESK